MPGKKTLMQPESKKNKNNINDKDNKNVEDTQRNENARRNRDIV